MSILDIKNRTENWRTARFFAPFFDDHDARIRLAERLLNRPDKPLDDDYVKLELFWQGMRDHVYAKTEHIKSSDDKKAWKNDEAEKLVALYNEDNENGFAKLRADIDAFNQKGGDLRIEKEWNYQPKETSSDKFFTNLSNTEIDIVLETRDHLFIGEAKYESDLGKSGELILVHQLIRQYVMAKILMDYIGKPKKVVPFLVVSDVEWARKTNQVKFMVAKEWLKENNILSWGSIESLAKTPPP